jgi:hypothetical protein
MRHEASKKRSFLSAASAFCYSARIENGKPRWITALLVERRAATAKNSFDSL